MGVLDLSPGNGFSSGPTSYTAGSARPGLTQEFRRSLLSEQAAFDLRFPPLPRRNDDILIVGWSEIERQFLDLCAPWDRDEQALMIRAAQESSPYESPEKTIRTLFVLNNIRSSTDSRPVLSAIARS